MNEWSKDECTILAEMWRTHTAGQIAARLNKTRNSVIGKAHRMKLFKKPNPVPKRTPADYTPQTIKAIYAEIERNNLSADRKGNRVCVECGEPVAGHKTSYCHYHHSVYHVKPTRKNIGERTIWKF